MTCQQVRERIAGQEGVFALAQRGERIEPLQLRIHEARMAHDHAAIRQLIEEAGEQGREIGVVAERIGARETRIGAQAERIGALPEIVAQVIEQPGLAVAQAEGARRHPPALPQPGARRIGLGDLEHRFADLRKQMHVLMAVDEIGRAAEGVDEHPQLRRDLARERGVREPVQEGPRQRGRKRQESALAHRLVGGAERAERCRQGQVQPDRDPRHPGIEDIERMRLRAMKARRHHHGGGGIEPPAHHQIADRHADAARNAVVVGAQPDPAAPRERVGRARKTRSAGRLVQHASHSHPRSCLDPEPATRPARSHSAAVRVDRSSARPASSAVLRLCSATK